MRTTEGIVTRVFEDTATIRACRPEACASCRANGICGVNTATMEIRVARPRGVLPGDSVLVGVGSREFLRVMALLYLLPVCAFVPACLAGHHAALKMHLPPDPIAALSGLFCLGLAFLLIRKAGQRLSLSPAYAPRILRRLPPSERSGFPDTPLQHPDAAHRKTVFFQTKSDK